VLNLPDSLLGEIVLLADFLESERTFTVQAEMPADDIPLDWFELC